ncbi:MAG: hypothetical protein IKA51_05770 [Clostridia bacterium]|nr:hypothetical protein [Clostridia bacterium]
MKKTVSIVLSAIMLLLAFCSCTSNSTEFSYSSDMRFVLIPFSENGAQSSVGREQPVTLNQLLDRCQESEENGSELLIFKGKVAGNSTVYDIYDRAVEMVDFLDPEDEKERIIYSGMMTPVQIEELYYSTDPEIKENDIITLHESYVYLNEELFSKIPGLVEKYDLKIGDLLPSGATDQKYYKEMFLEKEYSYIIISFKNIDIFNDNAVYFHAWYYDNATICIDKEPTPIDYYGEDDRRAYSAYLNIRKEAIDYYINGNKEVLS